MPLQKFPLLQDNTRLIRFKDTLYKVKVKYRSNTFPLVINFSQKEAHDEIEQTFRAVLYLSERNQTLKTVATPNFLIEPFKIPWSFPKKCSDYAFQQNGKTLKVFDHMFEFQVSFRDSVEKSSEDECGEKSAQTADLRSNVQNKLNQAEKTKFKEAVVVVSDINSDGTTRFGRTKAGQLFRVYTHNAKRDDENSHKNAEVEVQKEQRLRSVKKTGNPSKQCFEGDGEAAKKSDLRQKEAHLRKVTRGESHELIADKHGQAREQTVKKHSDRLELDVHNSKVDKSRPARDRFSLKVGELEALKKENIQEQRLRSRKSSCEKRLSYSLREHTSGITYKEQATESETSQTEEEADGRENVQSNTVAGPIPRHEKRKKLRKSDRKQIPFNNLGQLRSKQAESKKLKNNKSLRGRNRHRKFRISVGSSSRSRRSGDTGDDTDYERRNPSVGNDLDVLNDKINWNVRTRSSDRFKRNSQAEHERRDTSVESDINENTKGDNRRHSSRLATITIDDNIINRSPNKNQKISKKRKSESLNAEKIGDRIKLNRSSLQSESRQNRASLTSSDSESRHSPRKISRQNKKRKVEIIDLTSYEDNATVSQAVDRFHTARQTNDRSRTVSQDSGRSRTASQDSGRSRTVKLYASRHSPQVVGDSASKRTTEVSSPLVSTVLPVKRKQTGAESQRGDRPVPTVTSPRITRQSLQDDEGRRIESLREERPTQIYRDIMLAQGRDRHLVEQAENAETDKLRQLYEPTVPRRSPRLTRVQGAKRRSSGLWGKIMDTLVTPSKKYMFGNRK